MKNSSVSVAILLAATLVAGCKDEKKTAPTAKATAPQTATGPKTASTAPKGKMPPGHPPTGGMGQGAMKRPAGLSGKVLETMDAGGYSYVKLETPKGPVWAAIQKTPIKVGQVIGIARPMLMQKFKSKTLNRTFDQIYFGSLAKGVPAGGEKPVHVQGGKGQVAAAHKGNTAKMMDVAKVEKAKGGFTIAEVFSKRKELANKKVLVRGKVTKFNSGIMGRNWLHIQDGTGSAKDKSFDLTVTTQGKAKVGDTVLIEGTLAVDKDFGAGYAYAAIVEKAVIKN